MEGASGKNDANDAAAICEAASRPKMRFIPVKSIEQQSMLCVHRLREGFKEDRTACINRIRGLLAEFGLVFPQSPRELQAVLSDVLEDAGNELGTLARLTLQRAQAQWRELDDHLAWCDERIDAHRRSNPEVQHAATLIGIGPVTASAAIATVGDFKQFKNGAQFGWIGRHHGNIPAAARTVWVASPSAATPTRTLWSGRSRRYDGAPTTGQDLLMGSCAARALGLAEGGGRPGQQERSHPLGSDDARRRLRSQSPERQAHSLLIAAQQLTTSFLARRDDEDAEQVRPAAGKLD
jgi:hypothetical protein